MLMLIDLLFRVASEGQQSLHKHPTCLRDTSLLTFLWWSKSTNGFDINNKNMHKPSILFPVDFRKQSKTMEFL